MPLVEDGMIDPPDPEYPVPVVLPDNAEIREVLDPPVPVGPLIGVLLLPKVYGGTVTDNNDKELDNADVKEEALKPDTVPTVPVGPIGKLLFPIV